MSCYKNFNCRRLGAGGGRLILHQHDNGYKLLFSEPRNVRDLLTGFVREDWGERLALWGMSRTNPFLPLPGLGFDYFNRLQYRVLQRMHRQEDPLRQTSCRPDRLHPGGEEQSIGKVRTGFQGSRSGTVVVLAR